MNIPENDPRLRAAQEAIERARAKRAPRPEVEAGPDYRRVHIPDAAPGQEMLMVEVEKPKKEPVNGCLLAVGVALLLYFMWPIISIIINLISYIMEP